MKHRYVEAELPSQDPVDDLCRALLSLDRVEKMRAFLLDLCTPAELEALSDRWRVVPYLLRDMPYRQIHDRTAVSVTTIGRVARFLSQGNGGYQAALAQRTRSGARTSKAQPAAALSARSGARASRAQPAAALRTRADVRKAQPAATLANGKRVRT